VRYNAPAMIALVVAAGAVTTLALVERQPADRRIAVSGDPAHPQASGVANQGTPARPAHQQPMPDPSATLPTEYAFLKTRNPFAHGGHTGAAGAGGPDATLVFHGVAEMGASFTAFIEDMPARHVLQLSAGDAVGRGKIRSIDIDSLEFDVAGKIKRIEVGQNLNGEVVASPPPKPPASPEAQAALPGPPGGPPMGGPGGHHQPDQPAPPPDGPPQ
jgi:hypothetical protein